MGGDGGACGVRSPQLAHALGAALVPQGYVPLPRPQQQDDDNDNDKLGGFGVVGAGIHRCRSPELELDIASIERLEDGFFGVDVEAVTPQAATVPAGMPRVEGPGWARYAAFPTSIGRGRLTTNLFHMFFNTHTMVVYCR